MVLRREFSRQLKYFYLEQWRWVAILQICSRCHHLAQVSFHTQAHTNKHACICILASTHKGLQALFMFARSRITAQAAFLSCLRFDCLHSLSAFPLPVGWLRMMPSPVSGYLWLSAARWLPWAVRQSWPLSQPTYPTTECRQRTLQFCQLFAVQYCIFNYSSSRVQFPTLSPTFISVSRSVCLNGHCVAFPKSIKWSSAMSIM